MSLVLIMSAGFKFENNAVSIVAPMAMISLFTLSAAVMGYLFGYQPFQLYFDGKKKLAVKLFLQTVAVFGGMTILILMTAFFLNLAY